MYKTCGWRGEDADTFGWLNSAVFSFRRAASRLVKDGSHRRRRSTPGQIPGGKIRIPGTPRLLPWHNHTPGFRHQPPAYFHAGGEFRLKFHPMEAQKADEGAGGFKLHGIQAIALFIQLCPHAVPHGAGFLLRQHGREEAHHQGAGVHGRKKGPVRFLPRPEFQTGRFRKYMRFLFHEFRFFSCTWRVPFPARHSG